MISNVYIVKWEYIFFQLMSVCLTVLIYGVQGKLTSEPLPEMVLFI